jgi:hypothetical protein
MTRYYLTLVFAAASVAGFALILYAILTGSRPNRESTGDREDGRAVDLGFSGSVCERGAAILDLDMGHEGLKHREKEPFDPDKHKPQPV